MWWEQHWVELAFVATFAGGWATLQATLASHAREFRAAFARVTERLDVQQTDPKTQKIRGPSHLRGDTITPDAETRLV